MCEARLQLPKGAEWTVMTIERLVALLKAVTELMAVLVWPGIVLFILMRYGTGIRDFFADLGEFTLKGAGVEASMKRRQAEAAAALGAATTKSQDKSISPEQVLRQTEQAAAVVRSTATPRVMRRVDGATILWVDDRPDNNIYERRALEALGFRIVLSASTEDALEQTRRQRFDVIISDVGRPPDNRAGYTLLDALRKRGDLTPFIIYASSDDPKHRAEAIQHGAVGSTN